MTQDKVTNPFVLNERVHSFHEEEKQLFKNAVIRVVYRSVTRSYTVQIGIIKRGLVTHNVAY